MNGDVAGFVLQLGTQRVTLTPGVYRIGRDPICEVRLIDESVSRRHASLRVSEDTVLLVDDGSRNGVRVNGEKIVATRALEVGDRISVGFVDMLFQEEAPQSDPTWFGAGTRPLKRVDTHAEALSRLTPREREVFSRLASGESHREVAEALDVTIKTVETYRTRIGRRLGIKGRADFVRIALEAGLLNPRKSD